MNYFYDNSEPLKVADHQHLKPIVGTRVEPPYENIGAGGLTCQIRGTTIYIKDSEIANWAKPENWVDEAIHFNEITLGHLQRAIAEFESHAVRLQKENELLDKVRGSKFCFNTGLIIPKMHDRWANESTVVKLYESLRVRNVGQTPDISTGVPLFEWIKWDSFTSQEYERLVQLELVVFDEIADLYGITLYASKVLFVSLSEAEREWNLNRARRRNNTQIL